MEAAAEAVKLDFRANSRTVSLRCLSVAQVGDPEDGISSLEVSRFGEMDWTWEGARVGGDGSARAPRRLLRGSVMSLGNAFDARAVAIEIAHRFLLCGGHSDWCQCLIDVETVARSGADGDDGFGRDDAECRAGHIACELLRYLGDNDHEDRDKARLRLVEIADAWSRERDRMVPCGLLPGERE